MCCVPDGAAIFERDCQDQGTDPAMLVRKALAVLDHLVPNARYDMVLVYQPRTRRAILPFWTDDAPLGKQGLHFATRLSLEGDVQFAVIDRDDVAASHSLSRLPSTRARPFSFSGLWGRALAPSSVKVSLLDIQGAVQ